MSDRALWTVEAMAAAMGARARGRAAGRRHRHLDRHPHDRAAATRSSPSRASRDGHDFVAGGARGGRRPRGGRRGASARDMPRGRAAARRARRARRPGRSRARGARAHRARKVDRASPARSARPAPRRRCASRSPAHGATHASAASYNNHWGVPLSLARMPASAQFGVFEIGMNHAGEITPLTRLVRPHVAIITTIEPVHLEYFGSLEAIADAKAEIFLGLEPGGARCSTATIRNTRGSRAPREAAGVAHRVVRRARGRRRAADQGLAAAGCSTVAGAILGTDVTYKLGAPGRHVVLNSLAVLAAAALSAPISRSRRWRSPRFAPPAGRGARIDARACRGGSALADRRELQRQSGLDARGARAARPGAGRRAAAAASRCSATCWSSGRRAPALHRGLVEPIIDHDVDLVFCAGPLMQALWEALPSERRGGYAESAAALEAAGARRRPRRRRHHGQGLARLAAWDRSSRRWHGAIARARCASRRRAQGLTDALLAGRILRQDLRPQRLPLPHLPHRRRGR